MQSCNYAVWFVTYLVFPLLMTRGLNEATMIIDALLEHVQWASGIIGGVYKHPALVQFWRHRGVDR